MHRMCSVMAIHTSKNAAVFFNGVRIAAASNVVASYQTKPRQEAEPFPRSFTVSGEISMSREEKRALIKSLRGRLRDRRRRARKKNLEVSMGGILIGRISVAEMVRNTKRSLGRHDRWSK